MFCFMLDNTIMLTVSVTNIECLLMWVAGYKFSIIKMLFCVNYT